MKKLLLLSIITMLLLCTSFGWATTTMPIALSSYSSPDNWQWCTPTRSYSPQIHSVTAMVDGNWQTWPMMHLQSHDILNIAFDDLSADTHQYVCKLQRCEPDWSPSSLFESDWLDGNNDMPIADYQHSINTTVAYTHYAFSLPNDWCRIKISGNYRLLITEEHADSDTPVAEVRFMVIEPQVNISLQCTANTDIDINGNHQQLTVDIDHRQLRITDSERQLYTIVMQNWQHHRINVRPTYQTPTTARWQHTPEYIFLAGNEYRKYEMLSTSHATMGIERMEWDGHAFQAYPFIDHARLNYLTDEGAKGFALIRNSNQEGSATTCDYVWVNYRLYAPYEGERYVFGLWADQAPQAYLMHYNEATSSYEASILQKQGYYSYLYRDATGHHASTEGNFFPTRNNYEMLVYYRPIGGRSWLLVGFAECVAR